MINLVYLASVANIDSRYTFLYYKIKNGQNQHCEKLRDFYVVSYLVIHRAYSGLGRLSEWICLDLK